MLTQRLKDKLAPNTLLSPHLYIKLPQSYLKQPLVFKNSADLVGEGGGEEERLFGEVDYFGYVWA